MDYCIANLLTVCAWLNSKKVREEPGSEDIVSKSLAEMDENAPITLRERNFFLVPFEEMLTPWTELHQLNHDEKTKKISSESIQQWMEQAGKVRTSSELEEGQEESNWIWIIHKARSLTYDLLRHPESISNEQIELL